MSLEDRYSVSQVNDRQWVVIDNARGGVTIAAATTEEGARNLLSLAHNIQRPQ